MLVETLTLIKLYKISLYIYIYYLKNASKNFLTNIFFEKRNSLFSNLLIK